MAKIRNKLTYKDQST